jgi:hypothetical protein
MIVVEIIVFTAQAIMQYYILNKIIEIVLDYAVVHTALVKYLATHFRCVHI